MSGVKWLYVAYNFNPRSREGSDKGTEFKKEDCKISIRAPARGATSTAYQMAFSQKFQSALPRGERPLLTQQQQAVYKFQSALPRGERPDTPLSVMLLCHFNPRSREGSDTREIACIDFLDHFNPRSREGSDAELHKGERVLTAISIRAPARGATADKLTPKLNYVVFQSALPRGERPG